MWVNVTPRIISVDTLNDYAQDWLAQLRIERGASPHTVSNYRRDITRYIEYLENRGQCTPSDIHSALIERYLQELSSGQVTGNPVANSSVARAAASIRGFHKFLLRESVTQHDPASMVKPPQQRMHLPKALTVEEITALLDAVHRDPSPKGLRDAALLELLYATGARVTEAVSLSADDVDLDEEMPVIRFFGKGRKERLVPLGHYAKDALSAYLVRGRPALASLGSGYPEIFLNLRGKPLSRQSAWEILQYYAKAAHIEREVSPHTLRHSFATHLLEGGASVRDVQELLGHSSVQTTQIYTKVTQTTLREVYRSSHPRAHA